MIEELYSKYQASSINIRKHSLTEIDTILKQKFKAVSIDKMDYQEMKEDPYIYFDDICAGFKIMGNIVAEVQMDGEKEIAQMIVENILDDKDLSEEEKQKEINDTNTLLIFLQSKDLQFPRDDVYSVVTGYVPSVVFNYIMMILEGHCIEEEKCDLENYEFQAYLKALHVLGYLA